MEKLTERLKESRDSTYPTYSILNSTKLFNRLEPIWHGLCIAVLFSTFVFFSIPIYLYRYVLSTIIVPRFFSDKIGRPVTPTGNTFAVEFLDNFPPRCAVVTNIVIRGTSTPDQVRDTIDSKWINRTCPENSDKPYFPELKQYIEQWMGFLFWRHDLEFDLNNHLFFHDIARNKNSDLESETFVCSLMEELLNKPFHSKRSPWEIHMIQNYMNSNLENEEEEHNDMTVFIFRFHHGLADGFSILHAIVEGLFGTSLGELSLPSTDTVTITPEYSFSEELAEMISTFYEYSAKILSDLGYISSLIHRPRTSWHVKDRRKTWKQLYARSPLIPVEKLKLIKEKYGVSFTGVLFSCISAGISKNLKKESEKVESLPTLIPLPLAGHPMKLKNHVTGTIFDLPVKSDLQPICRLMECEKRLQTAKKSTIPILAVIYSNIVGSHLAPVAKTLLKNRVIPMGLSNFPGPKRTISWYDKEGLTADFAAGAVNGVAGVGFMVFSYRDYLRIAATAEMAVMNKADLESMISDVCGEIDVLENSALMSKRKSPIW